MKKYLIIPIVMFVVLIFVFGIYVGVTKIFPYDILNNLKDELESTSSNIKTSETSDFDAESLININEETDVYQKRQELIQYVWKTEQLPQNVPTDITAKINDQRFANLDNLKEIHKISVEMKNGITSVVYLFHPNETNDKLIIYHQGHSGGFIKGKSTINEFLTNGYSVAAFSMPLFGMNNQPIIDITNIGPVKFQVHRQFSLLETDDFSPISYFFTPIAFTLNYFDKNYEFTDYYMVGISGGGWTTTVYSAIDPRISKSFEVNGSIPLPLRSQVQDIGDWEQFHPGIHSIANYLQLYVMSSHGENRKFVQIFNEYDPCCFAGTLYELYEDEIRSVTSNIGNGKYNTYLDSSHTEHKISESVIEFILETIN